MHEQHYAELTGDQLLRNADSYVPAAVSLYLGRLVRSAAELYDHSARPDRPGIR